MSTAIYRLYSIFQSASDIITNILYYTQTQNADGRFILKYALLCCIYQKYRSALRFIFHAFKNFKAQFNTFSRAKLKVLYV